MEKTQIISIISVVLGLVLLLTSSLFLDDWRKPQKSCNDYLGLGICKALDYYVIAASFGIIASIIQLGAFAVAFLKKWKIWCGLHVIIFLVTLIAFSLAIDQHADDIRNPRGGRAIGSRAKSFLAFSAIDFIFSFVATGAMYFFTKK